MSSQSSSIKSREVGNWLGAKKHIPESMKGPADEDI